MGIYFFYDHLQHNNQWQQVANKEKQDESGRSYYKIKYKTHPDFQHDMLWRASTLFSALVQTLTIVPLFNDRKNLFNLTRHVIRHCATRITGTSCENLN